MNRIRTLREDRDLRQVDVANATGIDQKTLSNYETGRTNPDSYAIIKLADFFGVSADYILNYNSASQNTVENVIAKIEALEKALQSIKEDIKKI